MATHGRRRALGQHFLKDPRICDAIAEKAISKARETGCVSLLEIGPGKGAITLPLLEKLKSEAFQGSFSICEKDPRLIEHWSKTLSEQSLPSESVRLLGGDFLAQPKEAWLSNPPLAVVSNLPYSVGTAILDKLARHPSEIPVMVLMFQAEVARRLRAEPRTKAWGSLSLWIQNRWEVSHFLSVPPRAFSPPPEVDSEVVLLERRETPLIEMPQHPEAEKLWEQLLKLAFAHRRKMLRSGLPKSGPWMNALEIAGIEGSRRAEELEWKEWNRWFQSIWTGSGRPA